MRNILSRPTLLFLFLYLVPNLTIAQPQALPEALSEKTSESSREVFEARASNVETYEQLIAAIREVRSASQQRIEAAVESEKVREVWLTGKLIDGHILFHKERQNYGGQIMIRLAKDLGTSESELRYTLQFARTYAIHPPGDELSWSHYRSLLAVNDPMERDALAKKAVKENWSRDRVRKEVHKRKTKEAPKPQLEEAKPGKVGVYRIVKALAGPYEGDRVLDLGFSIYFKLGNGNEFKEGDLVKCKIQDAGSKKRAGLNPVSCLPNPESKASDLYTYQAYLLQGVDGDTFHANIDLGFGILLEQRLRLRQLDAPEIISAQGKEAKAALEKILRRDDGRMVIKTSKSDDQFGRYMVDLWIKDKSIEQELLDTELFTVRGEVS